MKLLPRCQLVEVDSAPETALTFASPFRTSHPLSLFLRPQASDFAWRLPVDWPTVALISVGDPVRISALLVLVVAAADAVPDHSSVLPVRVLFPAVDVVSPPSASLSVVAVAVSAVLSAWLVHVLVGEFGASTAPPFGAAVRALGCAGSQAV